MFTHGKGHQMMTLRAGRGPLVHVNATSQNVSSRLRVLKDQNLDVKKNGIKCIRVNEKSAVLHFPFSKQAVLLLETLLG